MASASLPTGTDLAERPASGPAPDTAAFPTADTAVTDTAVTDTAAGVHGTAARTGSAAAPSPGEVVDCAPHALRARMRGTGSGASLLLRRTIERSPERVHLALTDPSALLLLHGAGEVAEMGSPPWRLEVGSTLDFVPRRGRCASLAGRGPARLTLLSSVPGRELSWQVDHLRSGRTAGRREATVRLSEHPLGCAVELEVLESGPRTLLPGRRRELAANLTAGLRDLDLLLTRHDR